MYRCILFDMDGTLVNSYEGIYHAYEWAFAQMELPFQGDAFVKKAIGAPLPFAFEQLYGLSSERAAQAIRYYRDYYARQGRHEAFAYPGIREALQGLKSAGCFLCTATLKKQQFAQEMLEELGLLPFFDAVCGADEEGRLTKADLIRAGMRSAGVHPEETVLVGDSEFDAQGARQSGVSFLAVTYGFGYQSIRQARALPEVTMAAQTPAEIARLLRA